MNAILIALLVALGLFIVISAYVSALCARGSRERYSLRVRDENEIGWMDARGDLYRELCARRRARIGRVLMVVAGVSLLALLILLTTRAAGDGRPLPPAVPAALPADPFQRCAVKALRGDYGTLADWQRRGYQAGLAAGVTVQGTATVTTYYPQEGFPRGQATRSGVGVCEKHAACLRREWPRLRGSYVWVQPTTNSQGRLVGGIRQIMDTGANGNHQRFGTRMGSDRWLDYWYPTPTELVRRAPYAIWEAD